MSTDRVVRLRRWGTDESRTLDPASRVRLVDADAHAEVVFEREAWWVRGAHATRQDGELRGEFSLAAGVELGLGNTVLIAESERSIALRARIQRYLGWAPSRQDDVDRALRTVRDAVANRVVMAIVGEGNRAEIARELLGRPPTVIDRAGSVLDPRRMDLVLSARDRNALAGFARSIARIDPIEIPQLRTRDAERDRLATELVADAAARLGASQATVVARDLDWLRRARTLDALAVFATRLVAIRGWGVTHGAAKLGITHGALSRWARRQRLAT